MKLPARVRRVPLWSATRTILTRLDEHTLHAFNAPGRLSSRRAERG